MSVWRIEEEPDSFRTTVISADVSRLFRILDNISMLEWCNEASVVFCRRTHFFLQWKCHEVVFVTFEINGWWQKCDFVIPYLPLTGPLPSFPIWANVALLVALEYEVLSDVLVAASDTIAKEYSKMSYKISYWLRTFNSTFKIVT